MDLQIKDHLFIVGGATSGFGLAIAKALASEGAHVIAVARNAEKLEKLKSDYPSLLETIAADLTDPATILKLTALIGSRTVKGMLINAGGPPAKTVLETTLDDWDNAYRTILRWKIELVQKLIPAMIEKQYGRILFIESSAVKQPLENLVLSNSLRMASVGFVKTLAQEISKSGVTINILAPGSHDTAAIERIYNKKSEQTGIPAVEIRKQAIQQIPVGFLGEAADFASLAIWLLSPSARFITGQTISVDGGAIRGVFG